MRKKVKDASRDMRVRLLCSGSSAHGTAGFTVCLDPAASGTELPSTPVDDAEALVGTSLGSSSGNTLRILWVLFMVLKALSFVIRRAGCSFNNSSTLASSWTFPAAAISCLSYSCVDAGFAGCAAITIDICEARLSFSSSSALMQRPTAVSKLNATMTSPGAMLMTTKISIWNSCVPIKLLAAASATNGTARTENVPTVIPMAMAPSTPTSRHDRAGLHAMDARSTLRAASV